MSDSDAKAILPPRDAAKDLGTRPPVAYANDDGYPPGRDAKQRLADKRIADKRRAALLRRMRPS